MNQYNPFDFLNNVFTKENLNAQQAKTQEFMHNINVQTQKQLAKVPTHFQNGLNVLNSNFEDLQKTIQESNSQFKNPQAVFDVWHKYFIDANQKNLANFQKFHNENVASIDELKKCFDDFNSQVKEQTQNHVEEFQKNSKEIIEKSQNHLANLQQKYEEEVNKVVENVSSLMASTQEKINETVEIVTKAKENAKKTSNTSKTSDKTKS